MRGHIREYRAGKWSFVIDVGKVDGKRKQLEKGGFTSKKDCETALNKKLVELAESGTVFIPSEKTFDDIFNEYIDIMKLEWTTSTLNTNVRNYNLHIKDVLGYRYMKSIKRSDINNLLKNILEQGFSTSLASTVKNVITKICKYAIEQKYIRENPSTKSLQLRMTKKPLETLSPDDIKRLLDLTKRSTLRHFIFIGIYTGMRAGELLGLRWRDINFDKMTIDINHQLIRENGRDCIGECKNGSARTIYIPKLLVNYLKDLKSQQKEHRQIAAEQYTQYNRVYNQFTKRSEDVDDFVLVNCGKVMQRGTIAYIGLKAKKAGIYYHPHIMRHTYATHLLESGCSIKMLQEFLGHKSAIFTLDIYSHVTRQHEKEIIDKFAPY